MAKSKELKSQMLQDITDNIKLSESVVIAEYSGINVLDLTDLRKKSRSAGVKLSVLKNTLAKKAIVGTPFEVLSEHLNGPLIYGFSEDPVAPAKLLYDFSKQNESMVIKGGALPGSFLQAEEVNSLATIPSKNELVGKLLGTLQAPISVFVRTINELPTRLVRALSAINDQKNN